MVVDPGGIADDAGALLAGRAVNGSVRGLGRGGWCAAERAAEGENGGDDRRLGEGRGRRVRVRRVGEGVCCSRRDGGRRRHDEGLLVVLLGAQVLQVHTRVIATVMRKRVDARGSCLLKLRVFISGQRNGKAGQYEDKPLPMRATGS